MQYLKKFNEINEKDITIIPIQVLSAVNYTNRKEKILIFKYNNQIYKYIYTSHGRKLVNMDNKRIIKKIANPIIGSINNANIKWCDFNQ